MDVDAAAVSLALADTWDHLIAAIPDGWTERAPGLIGAVTRVAVPTLNGIWSYGLDADAESASTLLDRVAAAGVPHCLQLRPGCDRALRDLAHLRGMVRETDVPLMVLDNGHELVGAEAESLVIRVLPSEQAAVHTEIAAAGFEAPVEAFRRLMTPAVLGSSGVCCYVGEFDGSPVVTAVTVRLDVHAGIFNVATLPASRRRGYGAAITAQAVRDALRNGAQWAWLQSSQSGYGVYERLGFRLLESWECWIDTG
jgi:ribosomal protein S18 acetylase RimI-like enzyme